MLDELAAILAADLPHRDDERKLARVLYDRCYTQSVLEPQPPSDANADEDLTAALIAANRSRGAWDEGWRIDQVLDDGRIIGRKGGAARTFQPGEFLTRRGLGSGPKAGAPVGIFLSPGSMDLQERYYFAFGETAGELSEVESLVRFYWNVSSDGAPLLMEAVTREFNRFQVPFRLKCPVRTSDYPRRDAGVLYVNRRYYPIAALLAERLHSYLEPWLYRGTPLFAKRLAPGLGLAEDPGGESFGMHRSKILAGAIAISSGKAAPERVDEVGRRFKQRGLSLDRPWLNPGSVDIYEFPYPVA